MADSQLDREISSDEKDVADRSTRNREVIRRYFEMVSSGDPEIGTLFAADAVWRTPSSSPMTGPFEGTAAVLELMGGGVGLYDATQPLLIEQNAVAAEGDFVFVEMTMTARTGKGADYQNQYVFVFRLRDGLIVEVHEHLDTLYAQRLLFDPVGQASPLER